MMQRRAASQSDHRFLSAAFSLLVLVIAAPAAAQHIEVRPSATHLYADQTLYIDVLISGSAEVTKPMPSASEDFEIVPVGGNPIRNEERTAVGGGKARRVHDLVYRFEAMPQRVGSLSLPPFEVRSAEGVQYTQRVTIAVSRETTDSLLICEVESQFETAYVGQPLELRLRVWIRVDQQPDFVNNLGRFLWDAQFRDEAASQLGIFSGVDPMQVRYNQSVFRSRDSSHRYHVFEVRKTIYPSEPGILDWGEILFAYNYPTSLSRDPFGGLRVGDAPLRLRRSPEIPRVEVRPLPTKDRPAGFRGAIGEYAIATVASPLDVVLGDPITLTIEISGHGLERLRPPDPALSEDLVRDFEIVPDDPAGEIFGSHKLFTRTIRPRRLDVERIPPLAFTYFDPRSGQYQTTYSESIPILVRPRPTAGGGNGDVGWETPNQPNVQVLLPIEENAARVLIGEPARTPWEIWGALLPMPLLFAGVLWQRHNDASAATRWSKQRRRDALEAVKNACARESAATVRGVRGALLDYAAACARRSRINDMRAAMRALEQSGVSREVIDAMSGVLSRLDEAAYSGANSGSCVDEMLAKDALAAAELIESGRGE